MKMGIRKDVDLTNIHGTLTTDYAGVPLELALPYKLYDYLQSRDNMPALRDYVLENGFTCNSVHATQGRLTDKDFLSWASETVRLAEDIGAGFVVFHPERAGKDDRLDKQALAIRNIACVQKETAVKLAVETFGKADRILTPEEIAGKDIPMVLDVSHLDRQRTLNIIKKHTDSIAILHLSEVGYDERERKEMPHMPIKDFSFQVLDLLKNNGWSGVVTLEYLPWHHYKLLPDREKLIERYTSQNECRKGVEYASKKRNS